MKNMFKKILIVSIIVAVVSVIGTVATRSEYNAQVDEAATLYKHGQFSYNSVYSDINSLLKLDKQLKVFYVFDVISGLAILGSAIGLKVAANKEN